MADPAAVGKMEKIVALCKRRGFIFQSSEIYGGLNGAWDYGPLGVELKRNLKDYWWRCMTQVRDDIVGMDGSILMNAAVWKASGHVDTFSDPLVECLLTKKRYRADQIEPQSGTAYYYKGIRHTSLQEASKELGLGNAPIKDPQIIGGSFAVLVPKGKPVQSAEKVARQYYDLKYKGVAYELTEPTSEPVENSTKFNPENGSLLSEPRTFNLMFKTYVGPVEDASAVTYLRPETAQAMFVQFKNVLEVSRKKLPFGIAQIGKAFRNEINPRNFTFRSREFEQMEIEFFCRPEEAAEWYVYWRNARFQWYVDLGLRSDQLRLRDHDAEELAFYSTATADIEYTFPFGTSELEGIAHRGNYDLSQHIKFSGKDLSYFDEDKKERFVPHVIEPSAGADRATLAFLCEAYTEDQVGGEARTVLNFHPRIAPVKAAVFPLVKRDGMPEKAEAIYREMKRRFNVFYDEKGAIGRRYRRQDEAGTPFCVTVDSQTLADGTVTFRDRDTCRQWRVPGEGAARALDDLLQGQPMPDGA